MDSVKARKPSRRERQKACHQVEILEAAEQVFFDKGFASATMEEIAHQADFSVGGLYYFFKNKEDLYTEILRDKVRLFQDRMREALARETSPRDQIKAYFQARLDFLWERPRFFRLVLRETRGLFGQPGVGVTDELVNYYRLILDKLEGIFARGVALGQFRPVGARLLVLTLEGILRLHHEHFFETEDARRDEADEEQLWDIFSHGAVRGRV